MAAGDREAQRGEHPEPRRDAHALDAGHEHQPRVRRLVKQRLAHERRRRSEAEEPHRHGRERVERQRRAAAPTGADRRMHRQRDDREEHGDRERFLRRPHRQQPDAEQVDFDGPYQSGADAMKPNKAAPSEQQPRGPQPLHVRVGVRGRGPGEHDAGDDDEDHREPGKQTGFGPIDHLQPSPQPQVRPTPSARWRRRR